MDNRKLYEKTIRNMADSLKVTVDDLRCAHGIHEGLFKAKYQNMIKFAIMFENSPRWGTTDPVDMIENVMPFWMENYFKKENYLVIDNKPVLFVFNQARLANECFKSIESQRKTFDKCREYAKAHGLKIVEWYIDDGVSGRKLIRRRPELQRMIQDAEKGQFDRIIFIKLDRFFRSVAEYHECMKRIAPVIWTATEEEYDLSTANGRMLVNMKLTIGEMEADVGKIASFKMLLGKVGGGEDLKGKCFLMVGALQNEVTVLGIYAHVNDLAVEECNLAYRNFKFLFLYYFFSYLGLYFV